MVVDGHPLANLHDVVEAIYAAARSFQRGIWWRGQSLDSADWRLLPQVYRQGRTQAYEKNVYARFVQGAKSRYQDVPGPSDLPGWLFLMQHHGLPTRLLDWTESPLVAIFFSLKENPEQNGTLWALSPFLYNQHHTGVKAILSTSNQLVSQVVGVPFSNSADEVPRNFAIQSPEVHIRMMVQLSRFTIHGSRTPLEEEEGEEKYLIRFQVPAAAKRSLLEELWYLGGRESVLFPDLDHLASELTPRSFEEPAAAPPAVTPPASTP
jgi:hypothetical protein